MATMVFYVTKVQKQKYNSFELAEQQQIKESIRAHAIKVIEDMYAAKIQLKEVVEGEKNE